MLKRPRTSRFLDSSGCMQCGALRWPKALLQNITALEDGSSYSRLAGRRDRRCGVPQQVQPAPARRRGVCPAHLAQLVDVAGRERHLAERWRGRAAVRRRLVHIRQQVAGVPARLPGHCLKAALRAAQARCSQRRGSGATHKSCSQAGEAAHTVVPLQRPVAPLQHWWSAKAPQLCSQLVCVWALC